MGRFLGISGSIQQKGVNLIISHRVSQRCGELRCRWQFLWGARAGASVSIPGIPAASGLEESNTWLMGTKTPVGGDSLLDEFRSYSHLCQTSAGFWGALLGDFHSGRLFFYWISMMANQAVFQITFFFLLSLLWERRKPANWILLAYLH